MTPESLERLLRISDRVDRFVMPSLLMLCALVVFGVFAIALMRLAG